MFTNSQELRMITNENTYSKTNSSQDYIMSLRWRKTGELVCGAKSESMKDDTYIDDRLHYELSVIQKVVVPDISEEENGLWHWLHGECSISEHPKDCRRSPFTRVIKQI